MSTIAEHLHHATAVLQNASDSPRLDAEILLAHILRRDRTNLLTQENAELEASAAQQLKSLILQRARGIPIPYLTGRQEFFGLNLEVTPDVLIPRPATELIVQAVLDCLPADTTMTIADIGTGSGAIALALAKHLPQATIIASDISPAALAVAKRNAQHLGLANRITFIQSSLLTSYKLQPNFVVSNLPYLRPEQLAEPSIQHEPKLALDGGRDGLELVDELVAQAAVSPKITGLALELDPKQIQIVKNQMVKTFPGQQIKEITDGKTARGLISWK